MSTLLEARALAGELARLQGRIDTLERAPRLRNASIEDTTIPVHDVDGTVRTKIGLQDDGAFTVIDLNAPPPATPTAPVLEERPGVLVVTWLGTFTDGSAAASDFSHVEVHVSTTQGFTPDDYSHMATLYSSRGESVTLALDEGTRYFVVLVAVNTSLVASESSEEASGKPQAATVEGGVTTFHEADEPLGLGAADDGSMWYETDNGNLPHRWSGLALDWIPMPVGSGAIADGAVTAIKAAFTARDIGGLTTYFTDTDPGAQAVPGDLWMDTTLKPNGAGGAMVPGNVLKRRNAADTGWDTVQDTGIAKAIQDAAGAQGTADAKVRSFAGSAPPWPNGDTGHDGDDGDLWINTGNQNEFLRWNGTTRLWVSMRDLTIAAASAAASNAQTAATSALTAAQAAQATADGAIRTYYAADPPWANGTTQPDAALGDMWFDQDDAQAYRWNGSSWQIIEDSTIAAALAAAQAAQTTADGKITAWYSTGQPWANGDTNHAGDAGDLWYDTDAGNKPYYYTGSVWQALPVGLAALASDVNARNLGGITTWYQSADPGAAAKPFDMWVDTTPVANGAGGAMVAGNVLRRRNSAGTGWDVVQDTGIAKAIADAAGAQGTADAKVRTFAQNTAPWPNGDTTHDGDDGDLWINTGNQNEFLRWNGSTRTWASMRDLTIAAAASAASNAQTAANGALTAAQAAQATADGAVRTYYAPAPPWANGSSQPPEVLGDMWFAQDDGQAYRWNGTSWQIIEDSSIAVALAAAQGAQTTADGKLSAYYQDGQPWANGDAAHAGDAGDLWYDTNDGNKAYYYTGAVWQVLPVGLAALASDVTARALGAMTTFYTVTDPGATAKPGDLWMDSNVQADGTQNVLKRRNTAGTGWDLVQDTGIAKAIADAAGAQGTADQKVRTFAQTTAPTGMVAGDVGDLWIDTSAAGGNAVKRWDGDSWELYALGTGGLADNAITTPKIGDGQVTSIKIQSLAADKITTGTLDVSGTVKIVSDLGTDTDSSLVIDTAGLRAYGDDGKETVTVGSDGKIKATGSFFTSTVFNEAQIEVGDLAGTGSNKTFVKFYVGDERTAAGAAVANYEPGSIESGLAGGVRYITIKAPKDPTRTVGTLAINSSTTTAGDRPTVLWNGDIRLNGARGILKAQDDAGARTRLDLYGSQVWMDIPSGTMRIDDGTNKNRIVSRNAADDAYRPLRLTTNEVTMDVFGGGVYTFDDPGTSLTNAGNRLMSQNAAQNALRNLIIQSSGIDIETESGYARMRGSANWRFQLGNPAGDVGLIMLNTAGLRVSTYAGGGHRPIAAASFDVNSDPGQKRNVTTVNVTDAWRAIRNLKAYEYERTEDGMTQRGLMAPDVAREAPIVAKDNDCVDLYGLATTQLVVVQELVRRVLALEKAAAPPPA